MGLKILRCTRCVHIFLCLDIVGARGEKKPKFSSKKLWKNAQFCFFSLERLVRHLITKTCKHLVHSSLFEAKKIQLFLNFVAIFLNLLFIGINYFCFPLLWAPGVSNQHKNMHAPCGHDYLRSHKISDFFDFFAIFFWVVKVLWPDGNGAKGHFYKWH